MTRFKKSPVAIDAVQWRELTCDECGDMGIRIEDDCMVPCYCPAYQAFLDKLSV